MPGYEVFGKEEKQAIDELFEKNGGILFAHGFDALRKGIYRVREFEKAFAGYVRAPFGQAVSSGSAALKVGLKSLGVKPGDEVITQAFTFVATVESILDVGATPVLVDIDDTLTMSPEALKTAITERTKAVIPVHMMGAPAAMDEIMAIATSRGVLVLEDAAQACGGTYKGRHLGTWGHLGAFSFDAGKVMITGEGGMLVTADEGFYTRARAVHDHGHEYNPAVGRGEEGALCTGFNYRMTELQGAIGLVQLSKLDMILARQRENKKKLMTALMELPYRFRRMSDPEGEIGDSIIFFLDSKEKAGRFYQKMRAEGLGTKNLPDAIRWHFARHWSHMFKEFRFHEGAWEKEWAQSADLLERAIALPVMVNMTDGNIRGIAEKILRVARELQ